MLGARHDSSPQAVSRRALAHPPAAFAHKRSLARVFVVGASLATLAVLAGFAQPAETKDEPKDIVINEPTDISAKTLWSDLINKSRPTAEHAALDAFLGDWEVSSYWVPGPEQNPIISRGVAKGEKIIGGRFVQISSRLSHGGVPSEGLVTLGFDARKKNYTFHGIDSFATYANDCAGAYDADKQQFILNGTVEEPTPKDDEPWRKYDYRITFDLSEKNVITETIEIKLLNNVWFKTVQTKFSRPASKAESAEAK